MACFNVAILSLLASAHAITLSEFHRLRCGDGVMSIEAFAARNSTHLITANYLGDSATVLRWAGWTKRHFEFVQKLNVQRPEHVLPFFTLEGTLLAIVSRRMPGAPVYQWSQDRFAYLCKVDSPPAMSWHIFSWPSLAVNSSLYLAAAVYDGESVIFRYKAPSVFERLHALPGTKFSTSIEDIPFQGSVLLTACASRRATAFLFDGGMPQRRLELGGGCGSFAAFTIEKHTYISAVGSGSQSAVLYYWNVTAEQFDVHQSLPTSGAGMSRQFDVGNTSYLAIANHGYQGHSSANSTLWKWGPERRFRKVADIKTTGAYWWASFKLGGIHALALVEGGDRDEVTVFLLDDAPPLPAEVAAWQAVVAVVALFMASWLSVRPRQSLGTESVQPMIDRSHAEEKLPLRWLRFAVACVISWNVSCWLLPALRMQFPCASCTSSSSSPSRRLGVLSALLALGDCAALLYPSRQTRNILTIGEITPLRWLNAALLVPCWSFFFRLMFSPNLQRHLDQVDREPYRVLLGVWVPADVLVVINAFPVFAYALAHACLKAIGEAVAFRSVEACVFPDAAYPPEVLDDAWQSPHNRHTSCGVAATISSWTRASAAASVAASLSAWLTSSPRGLWVILVLQSALLAFAAPALRPPGRLTCRAQVPRLESVYTSLALGLLSCVCAATALAWSPDLRWGELLLEVSCGLLLLPCMRFVRLYVLASRRLAIQQAVLSAQMAQGVELH